MQQLLGYSLESGIPYGTAFVKNGYVGRTFHQTMTEQPESSVQIKLNDFKKRASWQRKEVIMIDDSIVRGTTSDRYCEDVNAMQERQKFT